jgi:hypothetical protein
MKALGAGCLALSLLAALSASANESGHVVLQSGTPGGGTPLHDRGIYGQGQIVAVMDTGLDCDSCWFAEPDGRMPPFNLTIDGREVDFARRKVVAYDFLFSCVEHPASFGCEVPDNAAAWDNHGHGTHAAAGIAADKGMPLLHDFADGIASGAKLVIQDGGFVGGDDCTSRPGFGCPLRDLGPVLLQAYEQGARVHSNSWGDRQGTPTGQVPPTGNYTRSTAEIDAFVHEHPDMVVVFNAGNAGQLGAGSVSSPGVAKNAIQVGGAEEWIGGGMTIVAYGGTGPSKDGRIKPDFVGPANVVGADTDHELGNCDASLQGGTSFSSPPVAGAAALVRQYFLEGWYPSGTPRAADSVAPGSALVKATLMASARRVPFRSNAEGTATSAPIPSYEQGFGFPVLDDALYFAGDARRLFIHERRGADGLGVGSVARFAFDVEPSSSLRVALAWVDPPGDPSRLSGTQLVSDLDLVVTGPGGERSHGNEPLHPGEPDRANNAELVDVSVPATGRWVVEVSAHRLGAGATQGFALVVVGDIEPEAPARRRPVRR